MIGMMVMMMMMIDVDEKDDDNYKVIMKILGAVFSIKVRSSWRELLVIGEER